MQFNPSNQKGNNKDQVIGDNKDNTNINNADGKSENSVARNWINNNFNMINNSTMTNTVNLKK